MVFYGQNTYDIYVLEYLCRIHIETYGRYIYIWIHIVYDSYGRCSWRFHDFWAWWSALKERIQMHSSTVSMAHAKAIVAYCCPWQDKSTMTAESPATLWMKVHIWGKSSNMNSLIHGVYSNYLVIDLADYIFRSAFSGGLFGTSLLPCRGHARAHLPKWPFPRCNVTVDSALERLWWVMLFIWAKCSHLVCWMKVCCFSIFLTPKSNATGMGGKVRTEGFVACIFYFWNDLL